MNNQQTFKIKVVDAEQILINTEAVSLSARNRKGKFDILANHQPFICLLSRGDVIIRKPDKKAEAFTIEKGILRIAENQAVIMVNL